MFMIPLPVQQNRDEFGTASGGEPKGDGPIVGQAYLHVRTKAARFHRRELLAAGRRKRIEIRGRRPW
jgi:hypothetical protein